MAPGGYKNLMERFQKLKDRVYSRYVNTLWTLTKEDCSKSYSFAATYEHARIAKMTGHELRIRFADDRITCELVKNPSVDS